MFNFSASITVNHVGRNFHVFGKKMSFVFSPPCNPGCWSGRSGCGAPGMGGAPRSVSHHFHFHPLPSFGRWNFGCSRWGFFHRWSCWAGESQDCAENLSFRVDKAWRQRCSQRFRNVLETGRDGARVGTGLCWGDLVRQWIGREGNENACWFMFVGLLQSLKRWSFCMRFPEAQIFHFEVTIGPCDLWHSAVDIYILVHIIHISYYLIYL